MQGVTGFVGTMHDTTMLLSRADGDGHIAKIKFSNIEI